MIVKIEYGEGSWDFIGNIVRCRRDYIGGYVLTVENGRVIAIGSDGVGGLNKGNVLDYGECFFDEETLIDQSTGDYGNYWSFSMLKIYQGGGEIVRGALLLDQAVYLLNDSGRVVDKLN